MDAFFFRNMQRATKTTDASRAASTYADLGEMTVTITTQGGPVMIEYSFSPYVDTAARTTFFQVLRDATILKGSGASESSSSQIGSAKLLMFETPAAGTYTYKVQWKCSGTGTVYLGAATYTECHGTLMVAELNV